MSSGFPPPGGPLPGPGSHPLAAVRHAGSVVPARVTEVAARTARAARWLTETLGTTARVRLTVADGPAWPTVATASPYGLPQGTGDHLRIAAGAAPAHDALLGALLEHLPAPRAAAVRARYGGPGGLVRYIDLVGVHELTHLWQDQAWAGEPPLWLREFHANLAMVGYTREAEPELLPELWELTECLPDLPASVTPVHDPELMATAQHAGPLAFVWFHFGLTLAAGRVWDSAGPEAFRALYRRVRDFPSRPLPFAELGAVHPAFADVAHDWPAPWGRGPAPG